MSRLLADEIYKYKRFQQQRSQAWRHAGSQHERLHLALATAVTVRGASSAYKGGGGEGRGEDGGQAGWAGVGGGGGGAGGGAVIGQAEPQAKGRLRQLVRGQILEILRYFDHLHAAQAVLQGREQAEGDGDGGGARDRGGEGGGDAWHGDRRRREDHEAKEKAEEDQEDEEELLNRSKKQEAARM